MKTTLLIIVAVFVSSLARADSHWPQYGFAAQAFKATESREHQIRSSDTSAQILGWFGSVRKSLGDDSWESVAAAAKAKLVDELVAAGWKVSFDMGTTPRVGFDFQIMINAYRDRDQVQIRAVIFTEKNRGADIAFFEQKISKA
jgi:hypothetical protein